MILMIPTKMTILTSTNANGPAEAGPLVRLGLDPLGEARADAVGVAQAHEGPRVGAAGEFGEHLVAVGVDELHRMRGAGGEGSGSRHGNPFRDSRGAGCAPKGSCRCDVSGVTISHAWRTCQPLRKVAFP